MVRASDFGLDPPGRQQMAIMVTRRCTMTCAHCSVASGPGVGTDPTEAQLTEWLRQTATAGVRSVRFTGGEPMLRPAVLRRLLIECRKLGMTSAVTTNGAWATSERQARRHLKALRKAGLGSLTVSYDTYHAEFQGPGPALVIATVAAEIALPLNVSVVRAADDQTFTTLATRLPQAATTRLRLYDLQLVGRARTLAVPASSETADGFCTGCSFPAIAEDGRLMACNGPAYFERPESPLVVGSVGTTHVAELFERYRADPILNVIRTRGPAGLRDELLRTPGFSDFPFRARYAGICDLCHHITRDARAVAALRVHLSRPEAVAAEVAAWHVIAGHRNQGRFSLSYVNGRGACRLFFDAATRPDRPFGPEAAHVFGHAHLDWRALASYLGRSGLARPLQRALDDPELTHWAPAAFADQLRHRAMRDALREVVQREIAADLAHAATALGSPVILLKGMALLMRTRAGATARATSDVDVYAPPPLALALRQRLLNRGFGAAPPGAHAAQQHLEPISRQGVVVEIHTRLMPGFWGLPEAAMLASAHDVPGAPGLATLGPEAMVLQAMVHLTASFFSCGLKAAWDLTTLLGLPQGVDWDRLAALAARLEAPRAFWTPLLALADALDLPVPASLLAHAPVDHGRRRLDLIARARLFRAADGPFDLDVLTKAGVSLLAQSSLRGRAAYLTSKMAWRGGRPATWGQAASRARRADIFRQAWRHYRQFRRAVATAAHIDEA